MKTESQVPQKSQNPRKPQKPKNKNPKTKAQKPDMTGHLRTFDDHHT
jgi:hypothetical protein